MRFPFDPAQMRVEPGAPLMSSPNSTHDRNVVESASSKDAHIACGQQGHKKEVPSSAPCACMQAGRRPGIT